MQHGRHVKPRHGNNVYADNLRLSYANTYRIA